MFTLRPVNLLDFAISIASAIDHIDSRLANHHKRVAYIASQIALQVRLPQKIQFDIVIAGLLHDIGALSTGERYPLLRFDDESDNTRHCEAGYQLLKKFRYFSNVSNIIRQHHMEYEQYQGGDMGESVCLESMLLYLADRVDILIDKERPILAQVDRILSTIARNSGGMFKPEYVDAFLELAWKESFWLDIVSPHLEQILIANSKKYSVEMDGDDLLDFAELLAHVIDFRCHFTATHSCGVATVGSVLANLIGFSESECQKVKVAGYLHDIGKLAIPTEILEKNGRLSSAEFRTIKSHSYFTNRILGTLQGLDEIRVWAAMHHERLDGNGYPGRCNDRAIPLGARIIAAADVFTALLETRPYRPALAKGEVRQKLTELARHNILDRKVVEVLLSNFDSIDLYRVQAQQEAHKEYVLFRQSIDVASPGDNLANLNTYTTCLLPVLAC